MNGEISTLWEPGLLFIQEDASTHTARKLCKRLEDNNVEGRKRPPHSPRLNPIEHLWFCPKQLVYKIRWDIERLCRERVRDARYEVFERVWHFVDEG